MKAVVYTAPRRLELREVPEPVPQRGEVLLEVAHLGICGSDLLIWEGGLTRVRPPVVLGHEFVGVVRDPNGTAAAAGQRVVVNPVLSCGACGPCHSGAGHACRHLQLIGIDVDGAAAPLVTAPAQGLHPVPETLALREAALAEPTSVAVHMVRQAGVSVGDTVAVLGGGPVGALVAFVALAAGAGRVTVSEPHAPRRDLLAGLGLEVFDPSAEETEDLLATTEGGFDVVVEVTAVAAALATATALARVNGIVLLGGLPAHPLPMTVAEAVLKELTIRGSRVYAPRDMTAAVGLLDKGVIPASVLITREVPLAAAVSSAYEPLRSSPDDMKILITP